MLAAGALLLLTATSPWALVETVDPETALEHALAAAIDDTEEAARRIAELGPRVAPALLVRVEGSASSDAEEASLLGAAERLGLDAFSTELEWRAERGSRDERAAGLRVLGRTGGSSEFELALRLAHPEDEGQTDTNELTRSLAGLLERDEAGYSIAAELVRDGKEAEAIIGAVGSITDRRALEWMSRHLDEESSHTPLLLSYVASLGSTVTVERHARIRSSVRDCLKSEDEQVVRLAILATAALEDADASEELIVLLADEREIIRNTTYHALRSISRLDLPNNATSWTARFAEENAWRTDRLPDLVSALHAMDRRTAIDALREIAQHPWWRDELSAEVATTLEREGVPELRRLACEVLGALGSPLAICPLLDLGLSDEDVAANASAALHELTGIIPAEPSETGWRDALPSCP